MLAAAFGGIHGNGPALDAVIAAVDEAGIQTLINVGDCVVGHPWPNEVIDCLRARRVPSVQGEWDRGAVRFVRKQQTLRDTCSPEDFEALRWTHEHTRSENIEFLAGLPRQRIVVVDGVRICLCHGTPQNQTDGLRADDPVQAFRRIREVTDADIIVCGHTEDPFARTVDGILFVNPGFAGRTPHAAHYAVIDTEHDPWCAHFHHAAY